MELKTVEALFDSYSAAWAANDGAAIAGHWDGTDNAIFYKAEEIAHVFTSWEEITQYWAHNEAFHDRVRLAFSHPQIRPLPGGYAMVIVNMRWDIAFASGKDTFEGEDFAHGGKAMGGVNHTLCLIKETPGGLKFCGWSETPDAPITYVGRMYEWAASPDFKRQ
ncbi:MAG: hypothetical protein AAF862_09505 [Pseudomonadota bacterium]